jgi:5-methylcytosine-specific restriction endonuclease McrA
MAAPAASFVDGRKTCSACGVLKLLEDFRAHPTGLGGRRSQCRRCMNERKRAWKAGNGDMVRAQKRRYYARHRDRLNREKRERRDDAVRAQARARWHADPARSRAMNHNRRVSARSSDPAVVAHIAVVLGLPCAYCGATELIEVDHIVPLARGGAHEPTNLAPACRPCNRSKRDRLLSEWEGP